MKKITLLTCLFLFNTASPTDTKQSKNLEETYADMFCSKNKTLSCDLFAKFISAKQPRVNPGKSVSVCRFYAGSTHLYKNKFYLVFLNKSPTKVEIFHGILAPENAEEVQQAVTFIDSENTKRQKSPLYKFLVEASKKVKYYRTEIIRESLHTAEPTDQQFWPLMLRESSKGFIALGIQDFPREGSFDMNPDYILADCPIPVTVSN